MQSSDRIAGFAWPVPRSFAGAVSACRFEQGDVLYADVAGYETWRSAAPPLPILQVLDPPRTARVLAGEAEGDRDRFSVSWGSPVTLDVYAKSAKRPARRTTTQGRLFTCLWRGDLAALDEDSPALEPPMPAREVHRRLSEAVPAFVTRFAARAKAGGQHLLLLAVDDSSDAARVKAQAIESLLAETFDVETRRLSAAEAGLADADALHPAVLVHGLAVAAPSSDAIEQRLAGLLYAGTDESATRFSLTRHAHLAPLTQN